MSQSVIKNEDIAHIRAQVDRIVLSLYGNGKNGLITRVSLIEAETTRHGRNWASFIEMIIRDLLIALIMWMLLTQA
ncbi:MAG: hypothetical protein ABFS03_12330 [Chloroflexota bacterium]